MTIKDMEARSGMARANIRFYEAEGLLHPARLENGYRDYAEEDLTALLRVRLLRALGVPLDDIRSLQSGELDLDETLRRRLAGMELDRAQLESARAVCLALREEGASFDTLDAPRYLGLLESTPAAPAADALPPVPWRRYWARCFDMALCSAFVMAFSALVFHFITPARGITIGHRIVFWAAGIIVVVLTEPLFLSRLGTTPGKWIMGLRVTDPDGGLLRREDAFQRTIDVLIHGLGFGIPLVNLYTEIRSLVICERNEPLDWEDDSAVTVRDMKNWRYVVLGFASAAVIGLMVLSVLLSWRMPNRGDLTLAEFSRNYNRAAQLYDKDIGFRLLPDGTWQRTEDGVTYIGYEKKELVPPTLTFETRDGYVTGVSFEDEATPFLDLRSVESCLFSAFVGAQKEAGLLIYERYSQVTTPLQYFSSELSADVCGIHVERHITTWETTVPLLTFESNDDIVLWSQGSPSDANYASEEVTETRQYESFSMKMVS